jgi:hypothetical protein
MRWTRNIAKILRNRIYHAIFPHGVKTFLVIRVIIVKIVLA